MDQDIHKIDQDLRNEFLKLQKPAKYGTAGFRDLATSMPYVQALFTSRLHSELERLLLSSIKLPLHLV